MHRDAFSDFHRKGKVIVELSSTSSLLGKRKGIHTRFFGELYKRFSAGTRASRRIYDSDVFVGASLTLTNANDVAKLRAIPGIKSVCPVKVIERPNRSDGFRERKTILANHDDASTPVRATERHCGALELTLAPGIDYTHPALGAGFGPGHKVAVRGTHVAGIIGANPGDAQGVVGVVPDASLYVYRVFGWEGQVDDDVTVAALLRAFSDGNDTITLSLGGMDSWTESTTSVVAPRVAEHGRVVTVSVGNGGDNTGAWTTESPSGGINVIAVGSVDVPEIENGELVSNFSGYGPSYDMFFKPAVTAPGGNIKSLWPVKMGSFKLLSGTLMSTPHAAASAHNGACAYRRMRDRLETMSRWVPQSKAKGARPHTLIQQGAGLIDAWDAIHYETVVAPGELLLNATHWKTWHTVFTTNTGKQARTYALKHVPAGTANTPIPGSVQVAQYPVPQDNSVAARVHIAQATVTVQPGATARVAVSKLPPANADARLLPTVSGFIEVAAAVGTETLRTRHGRERIKQARVSAPGLLGHRQVDSRASMSGVRGYDGLRPYSHMSLSAGRSDASERD
ncbi:subtilisin-like protein [Auricularia subglabra TFB-10046 SS5]|nr:subtilisin-like protein [Auricularia subglabra TFB-10046 SS5]